MSYENWNQLMAHVLPTLFGVLSMSIQRGLSVFEMEKKLHFLSCNIFMHDYD